VIFTVYVYNFDEGVIPDGTRSAQVQQHFELCSQELSGDKHWESVEKLGEGEERIGSAPGGCWRSAGATGSTTRAWISCRTCT